MKRLALAAVVLFASAGTVQAAEDANGSWKWTVQRGGQTIDVVLTLKVDAGKLTGTMKTGDQEAKIEEGTVKDGDVSFKVTRERGGNKIVTKYSGKISGDSFKGKSEFDRNGQVMSRDFEGKRQK